MPCKHFHQYCRRRLHRIGDRALPIDAATALDLHVARLGRPRTVYVRFALTRQPARTEPLGARRRVCGRATAASDGIVTSVVVRVPADAQENDMSARRIRVGTAGWAVPRAVAGEFGAEGSALIRYATRLDAAEINSTFWRR